MGLDHYADTLSSRIDDMGESLRGTLSSASWLPKSFRPTPPRPPTRRFAERSLGYSDAGYFRAMGNWILEHQAWTAATVAFLGTGSFMLYRQRKAYMSKRRARRTRNGDRLEVVGKL